VQLSLRLDKPGLEPASGLSWQEVLKQICDGPCLDVCIIMQQLAAACLRGYLRSWVGKGLHWTNCHGPGIDRCGRSGCLLPDKRFTSAYSDCDLCLAFRVPTASTKLINY
jgi:hypothetical protein